MANEKANVMLARTLSQRVAECPVKADVNAIDATVHISSLGGLVRCARLLVCQRHESQIDFSKTQFLYFTYKEACP